MFIIKDRQIPTDSVTSQHDCRKFGQFFIHERTDEDVYKSILNGQRNNNAASCSDRLLSIVGFASVINIVVVLFKLAGTIDRVGIER